eukprot:6178548-Pleurochrysis_carterae.AAC.1
MSDIYSKGEMGRPASFDRSEQQRLLAKPGAARAALAVAIGSLRAMETAPRPWHCTTHSYRSSSRTARCSA